MKEKSIKFICERCGKKASILKRIIDKDPICGKICFDCLYEDKLKAEAKARDEIKKRQDKCYHNWYVLRDGDYDVLVCAICEKKIYP